MCIAFFGILVLHSTYSKYYNYAVSNNGKTERHSDNYNEDYFTDVIRNHTVDFIHTNAKGTFPFFMYIATPAPHRPATPAPQYANKFSGKMAPRTPSYNFTGMDKHWIISNGRRACSFTFYPCRGQ